MKNYTQKIASTPYKVLLAAALISVLSNSCKHFPGKNNSLIYADSNRVAFELPDLISEDNELKEINPYVVYAAYIRFDNDKRLLTLSKFSTDAEYTIEFGFVTLLPKDFTFGDIEVDDYVLKDFGIYEKEGKEYRYKVAAISDSILQINNSYLVSYYFMKNDKSKDLYEMKLMCRDVESIEPLKAKLEGIVKTVEFPEK